MLRRLPRPVPCAHPHCGHGSNALARVMAGVFRRLPVGTTWCVRLPTGCTASRHFLARIRIPVKARGFSTAYVTAGPP